MSAKAALAAVLSLVLASSSAAQTAVAGGRLNYGGARAVQAALGPPSTAPAPAVTALAGPSLVAPGLTPALAPLAAPAVAAAMPVAVARPAAALAARTAPAALAPARPGGEPERARAIAERIDELKAAFDEKQPMDMPVAPDAAQAARNAPLPRADLVPESGAHEPPRTPQETRRKDLFGFSRPLAFFLLALIVSQVGIEAQTAGLPPLIAKIFGNASVAAEIGIVGSIADLAGTVAAPIAAKKLGLKAAYLWSTGLRVATGGLIAGLLAANWVSLTGLVALFALDYLLYGVSYTLEKSIPAVMLDQDQNKLEKFKAARQTAIETVATIVPIATGALVAAFGFLPALIAFPVAVTAAMTLITLTLRLPAKIAGVGAAPLPGPQEGSTAAYFKHLGRGAAEVARTPVLLFSLLAYSFVYAPTQIVYWLLAPAFGLHMTADAAHATAYAGMITGLYSLGGIIAGVFVMRQQRKTQDPAGLRRSMLKWTAACAAAMALFGALALPGLAWGTLTLPALALFLFGVPQVVARLKLESFFQSRAPKGAVDDATAVLEGSAAVTIALGLWWFGKMLAGAHLTSLPWLLAAAAPLALALLALTWALARASRR